MKKIVSVITASLIMIGFVFSQAGNAQASERSEPVDVKLMSYNIHHAEGEDGVLDLERIAGIIEDSGADIIGLQEVDNHWAERSDFQDQAKWLANRLGMHYTYAANLDRDPINEGDERRQYGTAVLSQYPIIYSENHSLTKIGNTEQRGALEAIINVKGSRLHVFNTHLALTSAERLIQAREITELANQTNGAVAIMGDLNATPESDELVPLFTQFKDAFAGLEDVYTYSSINPKKRIDFIFTSKNLNPRNSEVITTLASDHLPITTAIELDRHLFNPSND